MKASGLHKLKKLQGKYYKNLDESAKQIFDGYKIKITLYSAKNIPDITEDDLNLFRQDAYERFKLGSTPLRKCDVARAKYQFDDLTKKFIEIFKSNEEFFYKCEDVLLPKIKQTLEDREKLNLVLVTIRSLLILQYIPIIGEKTIKFGTASVESYYEYFMTHLSEDEKIAELTKFKSILGKLYKLKQKLIENNNSLKDNILLYKGTYWMLSILYQEYSESYYNFNIGQFYRYLEKDAEKYFDSYKSFTSNHIESRHAYLCRYIQEELNLDISNYLEQIKDNKKLFSCKLDNIDKNWNSMGSEREVVPTPETMDVNEIIRLIKREQLIVQPDFQRAEVINKRKASRIIESILLGVKLPPIYLYLQRDEDGVPHYTVLDRSTETNKYFKIYGRTSYRNELSIYWYR